MPDIDLRHLAVLHLFNTPPYTASKQEVLSLACYRNLGVKKKRAEVVLLVDDRGLLPVLGTWHTCTLEGVIQIFADPHLHAPSAPQAGGISHMWCTLVQSDALACTHTAPSLASTVVR